MWEYYSRKVLFITGASGFLGTALVYRIISQAPVAHIYLLCRGGLPRLEEVWRQYLPSKYIECLYDTELVTAIKGDILEPNLGIDEGHLQALHKRVNIVIHTASPINLMSSLEKLANPVMHGSENVAHFALQCHQLDRFVYVSTAYVNAFLYQESDDSDPYVEETIYPLGRGWISDVRDEWEQVQREGDSQEYKAHNFPWPYGYAKHLTERLVLSKFSATGEAGKLLILRPSVIAPAQTFPYQGFSVPKSTPTTVFAAGFTLTPVLVARVASRANDPDTESTIDEVPVDAVVDRLLVHLAKGTTGPVHAVVGTRARYSFQTFWAQAMALRKFPWPLWKEWLHVDWRSRLLHPTARVYVIYAASYRFSEAKTVSLWKSLSEKERAELQLFTSGSRKGVDLAAREDQIRFVAGQFAAKGFLRRILFRMFYASGFF
ncbi:male sterility protein-domain-containing protein [Aspergillus caelatus]|uniref:Fatty acyl-CoA reductase n=1 Tax=Aspergillus caelatus TaxID=61420 RepID=A0A5N7AGS3_9EURO|nr:male sterility protein-domain-containing protein [Aspergillus caelatus]KAE8368488.1 male sterility protein-domain-containing protein [Aspergillus caelatus]